jgi:LacI family transcriptional regulator
MSKPPSLGDVARAARLSPAAVSRYLNGSLTLPHATSRRIDDAIAKLNYRPNPHARSLSRGRSDTIGLVVPEIANPFFSKLAAAVEKAADEAGLGVMLCSSLNCAERELDYIERLRKNFVDGLLFATNHSDNGSLATAINGASSVVLLDEDVDGTDVSKVFSDNEQGGELAARHLIEAGHKHIAFIGGPVGLMSSRERALGCRRAVNSSQSGAKITIELFGDYAISHGREAMAEILNRHADVTAVFAASDEILIGMLSVLRECGLHVGDHLSVVTFDDAGPLHLLDPPITAIRQSIDDIGRRALALIQNGLSGAVERVTERVPVELVVRSSVVAPRTQRRGGARLARRSPLAISKGIER